jgi:hypothetical protein
MWMGNLWPKLTENRPHRRSRDPDRGLADRSALPPRWHGRRQLLRPSESSSGSRSASCSPWILFARNINAVPDPAVPVLSVFLVAIGALVFANLDAALPGLDAAHTGRIGAAGGVRDRSLESRPA